MKLAELAKGIVDKVNGEANIPDIDVAGITSDSRNVGSGYLFAAIPGTVANGCDFIPQAISSGASVVLLPQNENLGIATDGIRIIPSQNPRQHYAKLAGRFFGQQPKTISAITGTNGKTSVAAFLCQIWIGQGLAAGSVGTLGGQASGNGVNLAYPGALTTPDPAELHRILADMSEHGVDHLALEASSHGLDQHRLDGVNVKLAAFTNLSRDHLDYHGSEQAYFTAKKRLFTELLQPNGMAVINSDIKESVDLKIALEAREIRTVGFGRTSTDIRLVKQSPVRDGQELEVLVFDERYTVTLPLVGAFQASNALCALGLAISSGVRVSDGVRALGNLQGVRGRMELAGGLENGASVYVDYAHTPDALVNVLSAVRQHTAGRLHIVFGCGGDRDPGKRKPMGEAAACYADRVILTDDNPRGENPASIRARARAGCPAALEIGDRRQAIEAAIDGLSGGDLLVVAGKGHEQGQIVGNDVLPFDDVSVIREILGGERP